MGVWVQSPFPRFQIPWVWAQSCPPCPINNSLLSPFWKEWPVWDLRDRLAAERQQTSGDRCVPLLYFPPFFLFICVNCWRMVHLRHAAASFVCRVVLQPGRPRVSNQHHFKQFCDCSFLCSRVCLPSKEHMSLRQDVGGEHAGAHQPIRDQLDTGVGAVFRMRCCPLWAEHPAEHPHRLGTSSKCVYATCKLSTAVCSHFD